MGNENETNSRLTPSNRIQRHRKPLILSMELNLVPPSEPRQMGHRPPAIYGAFSPRLLQAASLSGRSHDGLKPSSDFVGQGDHLRRFARRQMRLAIELP